MTTLLQMRDAVRAFVKDDNPASEKTSDAELNAYIGDGIADYSRHFPRSLSVITDPPTNPITMPTDALPGKAAVTWVEVNGVIWSSYELAEGSSIPTSGNLWFWRGGSIMFPTTPATAVTLYYDGLHLIPTADADVLTVPRADEELIVLYAAAKFHQKVGTIAAKLDRFKERGERDDNPLVLMHEVLLRRYDRLVADRMMRGTARIRSY